MVRNPFIRALLLLRKIDQKTAEEAEHIIDDARAHGDMDPTESILVGRGIVTKKDAACAREAVEEVKEGFSIAQLATDTLKRSSERLAELAQHIGARQPAVAVVPRKRRRG